MTVKLEKAGSETIVLISGRVDTITAPEFEKATTGIASDGQNGPIILDCKEMEYISSAGLRCFITLMKSAKAAGRDLKVINLSDPIRQIFDMTGFTQLFGL